MKACPKHGLTTAKVFYKNPKTGEVTLCPGCIDDMIKGVVTQNEKDMDSTK